ncbi:Flp pilus assembly protein CpaB [Azospirillum sp. ST 5-10]|uniref:Flp pilus assembly protein CpaB n=1 Tax=unclassified Azospirillum TaxID=2630922 RepID=UPI003F4A360A
MTTRAVVTLGLAVGLGTLSVVMARSYLERPAPAPVPVEAPAPAVEYPTVVVARGALAYGQRLAPGDLAEVPWAAGGRPDGAFAAVKDLLSGEPRVVLRPMVAGEPVLAGKVSGPGGRATLSTLVRSDARAVTIRVNDVNGVAGFVLPGDRVDVLLTRQSDPERPETGVLLQNVRVLAVDQEVSERTDTPILARAVTLEVAPVDAQKLTLGGSVGTLSLALRNHADAVPAEVRTVGLHDLGTAAPEAGVAEPPRHRLVRVVRAAAVEEVEVTAQRTVTRVAPAADTVARRPD